MKSVLLASLLAFGLAVVTTGCGAPPLTPKQVNALGERIDRLGDAAKTPGPRSAKKLKELDEETAALKSDVIASVRT